MKAFWDLDKEGQIKRSIQGAILCGALGLGILLLMWYANASVDKKEARCTSTTSGIIYSVHTASRYRTPSVSARYSVNGQEYRTSGEGRYPYDSRGKAIAVYYDPQDPSCSYTGKGMRRPSDVWYVVAGLFFAGCPLMIGQAKAIKKNGRIMINH